MAKIHSKRKEQSKQLTAQDIHHLVGTMLQEHFQLDMAGRHYEAGDIWDVLVGACVERLSLEMASQLLENAPTGTMVRTIFKDMAQG